MLGAAVAVYSRDGLLYEAGHGSRQAGAAEAMTPDTVVWVASMTKSVTVVAAMQCVERALQD